MNTLKHRAIRYFWDPEPRNDSPQSMIWCLGRQYPPQSPQQNLNSQYSDALSTWPRAFLEDFESRIWMTYRTDFPMIPRFPSPHPTRTIGAFKSPAAAIEFAGKLFTAQNGDGFPSDVGWGCMIRSAQSVLANALIHLHLGRGMSFDRWGWD